MLNLLPQSLTKLDGPSCYLLFDTYTFPVTPKITKSPSSMVNSTPDTQLLSSASSNQSHTAWESAAPPFSVSNNNWIPTRQI